MNILPKKSWHVRNKDNVAKVREDEENARLQAKEQKRRQALAEQEARTSFLREKARKRTLENCDDLKELLLTEVGSKSTDVLSLAFTHSGTVSQHQGIPSSSMKNEDHEREKKEEQVKYEKKIGLLTYLGQSAAETMEECEKPWYYRPPKRKSDHRRSSSSEDEADEKDLKRKASLDPMNAMKSNLERKKVADERCQKRKKHRRKHKPKHYRLDAEKEITPQSKDKLSKLREERLKREKKEKERTLLLLSGGENSAKEEPRRYNSQFNPHLVRSKNYSAKYDYSRR